MKIPQPTWVMTLDLNDARGAPPSGWGLESFSKYSAPITELSAVPLTTVTHHWKGASSPEAPLSHAVQGKVRNWKTGLHSQTLPPVHTSPCWVRSLLLLPSPVVAVAMNSPMASSSQVQRQSSYQILRHLSPNATCFGHSFLVQSTNHSSQLCNALCHLSTLSFMYSAHSLPVPFFTLS